MSYLAEQDRQQRITLLVILALGSLMIWHAPFGALLLYPFTILSTWFHEMGHGLSAILMGERFDSLVIYPDGSGVAMSLVSPDRTALQDAIIAAGGPIGPAPAGARAPAAGVMGGSRGWRTRLRQRPPAHVHAAGRSVHTWRSLEQFRDT